MYSVGYMHFSGVPLHSVCLVTQLLVNQLFESYGLKRHYTPTFIFVSLRASGHPLFLCCLLGIKNVENTKLSYYHDHSNPFPSLLTIEPLVHFLLRITLLYQAGVQTSFSF